MTEKVKRPPGYYSRAQREARSVAHQARKEERASARAAEDARRRQMQQQIAPRRNSAMARLACKSHMVIPPQSSRYAPAPLPNESGPMYSARLAEVKRAQRRFDLIERWKHKQGTVETHALADLHGNGPLFRLHQAGHIDAEQYGWACEISSVAEMIERDVEVKISKYRMPVDNEGSGRDSLVEGIMLVRREMAYTWWRQRIRHPQRAVLDMIVGEPISYSTAAQRYRMGKKRARQLLIDAIDLWPEAMDYAERQVDAASLAAAHAGLI